MHEQTHELPELRLSTDDVAPNRCDEFIRDFYGRMLMRMDVAPYDEGGKRISASAKLLPGLTIGKATTSPLASERTRSLLADGIDDVVLSVCTSGYSMQSSTHETVDIAPGDVLVTALNHPLRYIIPAKTNLFTLQVPRKSLGPLSTRLDDVPVRAASIVRPEWQILFQYARIVDSTNTSSPALRRTAATHLLDLITLALGATLEAAEVAQGRGLRAARLAAAKADIAANLVSPTLSAEAVAARLRVSPRYIRKLFASEGLSFSGFVARERLARVHRLLSNPRQTANIADIAFDAGFNEIATFNRLFRRRYGMTPSDVRHAARQTP